MEFRNKASRIRLLSFSTPQMRAFHVTWFAFFLCFFAWFGIAPLMIVVEGELGLSREQVGNCVIGSVAATILGRILIGVLCDRFGPRRCYTWLLILGSMPVMAIGLARSYEAFLVFRIAVGMIGASFVVTQYHTTMMFAPNCVGTANAMTAGWGNLGGGATQITMPLLLGAFLTLGAGEFWGWRLCMVAAGALCLLTGVAYGLLTRDTPDGNYDELRARGEMPPPRQTWVSFLGAMRDPRVWVLALLYGACFGMELTLNGVLAFYFSANFGLGLVGAGVAAGLFDLMNIFTRPLGGFVSDRWGARWGLRGRVRWLFVTLLAEGMLLMAFSRAEVLFLALPALVLVAFFVQMSNGATFSVVPFINPRALGGVAGVVGAGGNAGAVAAGFLFRSEKTWWPTAILILGGLIALCAFLSFAVRFSSVERDDHLRERYA